jgi:elongation factor 1-gamma
MALKLNYMTGNPRALKILMAAKLANVDVASHLLEWKDLEVYNLNNKRHQNI